MKERLIGLFSVSTVAISLILTSSYLLWEQLGGDIYSMMNKEQLSGKRLGKGGIASVPSVNYNLRKTIGKLQSKLDKLRSPGQPKQGRVDFEMIGFEIKESLLSAQALLDGEIQFTSLNSLIVSMTYISGENRFAVVNGKLFREGESLNENLHVKTVTPLKVLITSKTSSKWVETSNPIIEVEEPTEESDAPFAQAPQPKKPTSSLGQISQGMDAMKNYSNMLKSFQ